MTTLFAQPYDICAKGFYFDTVEQYGKKSKNLINDYGQLVEEFEIQFVDGEIIDAKLFTALEVHQGNFNYFLDIAEEWDEDEKIKVILAVGECGYNFNLGQDDPNQFEIDIYEIDTMRELAIDFVEQGLFGEIPSTIQNYLDYDSIAYDLSMDYSEATINNTRYIYRMG